MSERLGVEITAKDGASKVFEAVGKSSDKMGKDIEASAQRSSRALRDLDIDYRKLGASAGIMVAGLGLAGQAFRDQEIAIETMRRGYGDAADDMLKFADAMQQTTNFSNDAVVRAENLFRTLAINYGYSAEQIQQLLGITADLAAATGINIEDAAMRVQNAMRGEAESAEYMGLTLNDHALGIDRLAASTSEYEKSQLRFVALQDQAAFAMGAAEQQAQTNYGTLNRMKNEVQDLTQDFGGMLGPVGEFGAFMGDNALQVTAFTLAAGQLGSTMREVNALMTARTGTGMLGNIGSLAGLLMGPVGIVAAAGAAAVGIGLLARSLTDEYQPATELATTATQSFTDNLIALGQQGTLSALNQQIAAQGLIINQWVTDLATASDGQADFIDRMRQLQAELGNSGAAINAHTEAVTNLFSQEEIDRIDGIIDGVQDGSISFEELDAAIAQAGGTLDGFLTQNGASAAEFAAAWQEAGPEVARIMAATGEAGIKAQQDLLQQFQYFHDGLIGPEGFIENVYEIGDTLDEATAAAVANGEAMQGLINVYGVWMSQDDIDAMNERTAAYANFQRVVAQLNQDQQHQGPAPKILTVDDEQLRNLQQARHEMTLMEEQAAKAAEANRRREEEAEQAARGQLATARVMAQREIAEMTAQAEAAAISNVRRTGGQMAPLRDFGAALIDITAARDRIVQAYADIANAPQAMDAGYRVIVSNTDAIARNADQLQKWADDLIAPVGTWSKIDDLLIAGRIDLEQYTAAQQAQIQITEANAKIQEHVQTIQAKQAPVLGQLIQATETYMGRVAEMDGIQQTAALGFMDSAESAQALQLKMLALDAASGELGAQGTEWVSGIIEGAAAADPVLAAMLEQMGLISIGADGTITVNLDDQASGPMQKLNDSVEKLAYVQLLIVAEGDTAEAERRFEELFGHAADWDNTTATATLDVQLGEGMKSFGSEPSGAFNAVSNGRGGPRIVVTADTADAETAVNRVGEAVKTLGELTASPAIGAETSAADHAIGMTQSAVDTLDASVATPSAYLSDYASASISSISSTLDALDGKTATVYVTTVNSTLGAAARLGGVAGYDNGGTVIRAGEAGMERLDYPGGGHGYAVTDGLYTVPVGTYVNTAPATAASSSGPTLHIEHLTIQATGSDQEVAERVTRVIVPAIERAMRMHLRSLGVG